MRECARSLTTARRFFVFPTTERGNMSDLFKSWVFGTARHLLGGFFTFMAGKGIVTPQDADHTLAWLSGAVAVWLWSLYEKYRANKPTPSGRPPASTTFTTILLLISLPLVGIVACKKPVTVPGEDQAAYKKRLTAIYAGQTIVGIAGTNAGIKLLRDNSIFDKPLALRLTEVAKRTAIGWKIAAERLEKGFSDAQTTAKLQDLITDIEKLESDQAIKFPSDQARTYFYSITGSAKTSLAALQALLGGPGKPTPDLAAFEAKSDKARAQLSWIFDLSTLAFNTVNRMNQFSYFTLAEDAYKAAYAEQISVLASIEANILEYKE
jgi:hypothetical protein